MFSYITLGTNDLPRATVFYDAVMAALGISRVQTPGEDDWHGWAGWGYYQDKGAKELALWLCEPFDGRAASVGNGVMVAFAAPDWASVRAFHAAALASGGSSEGEPALRPQYNPDFYSAYIRDPDGNKLAAVCRGHLSDPGQR
ncbi:MAG: lactoylglutathione lyase [Pseudomonadales bacterium]|jgi:catechol 2,3-dioxygenase-like lactoylglutathione lyase family enzyme|nr:lactoylglutathione lyase [Pseudomonadales bacterium]MBU30529.1 lactoylglutathione lyase [Pseudomonadales bacterium]|tara:strand:- start:3117 stop:3545 length:429 start_codon:yes stop_codon:yes gene_type:complete